MTLPEPAAPPEAPRTYVGAYALFRRCAQRGIAPDAVQDAVAHGRIVHAAGARFALLGRRELREACANGADRRAVERLARLVVLLADDGEVITAYRNGRASADIRRKERYDRRRRTASAGWDAWAGQPAEAGAARWDAARWDR